MDVSIIIVSWNTKALLKKCLDSIFLYTKGVSYEIIIVDNNSSDGTQEMLASYPDIKIILNNQNLGFAKANNQGIRESSGKYIFLLNPDTEITKDAPALLAHYLRDNPSCGIAGPRLLNAGGSLQYSVRRFPKLLDQLLILLKLHNLFPKLLPLKKYFMTDFDRKATQPVDQLMGAAIIIKEEVIKKIGMFDENFWRNFEEVDFCLRAQHAGFQICYVPTVAIMHRKAESFKQVNRIRKQLNWNHDLLRFFKKHRQTWQWAILWIIQWVSLVIATVIQLMYPFIKRLKKKEL